MAVLLWGCTVLSDWLVSGNGSFQINEALPVDDYIVASIEAAKAVQIRSNLQVEKCLEAKGFCDLWGEFKPQDLRPLQTACEKFIKYLDEKSDFPAFILLEAPMGEGKTESGLFLTTHLIKNYHKTGFYIAMPTTATSNSMHERVQSCILPRWLIL